MDVSGLREGERESSWDQMAFLNRCFHSPNDPLPCPPATPAGPRARECHHTQIRAGWEFTAHSREWVLLWKWEASPWSENLGDVQLIFASDVVVSGHCCRVFIAPHSQQIHCIRSLVSDPLFQIPCIRYLISDPLFQIPCIRSLVSDPLYQIPCIRYLILDTLYQILYIRSLVSDPLYQIPCIRYLISDTLYQILYIRSLVSDPLYQIPCIRSLISDPLSYRRHLVCNDVWGSSVGRYSTTKMHVFQFSWSD